jgi:hypothetical protein
MQARHFNLAAAGQQTIPCDGIIFCVVQRHRHIQTMQACLVLTQKGQEWN